MPLTAGARLGPYEITGAIGAGGMAEVYRAHDTKLGRDVAVKILPELFVTDPERVARFEREAQLLAALNHPNIAHLYGLEGRDGLDGRAWARNGRELFYLDASNLLTAVPVQTSSSAFGAGNPAKLPTQAPYVGQTNRTYDVSPDGKRFLMIRDPRSDPQSTTAPSMVVVLNWLEELKARLPVR